LFVRKEKKAEQAVADVEEVFAEVKTEQVVFIV
jgi:hypothetical protein